MQVKIFIFIVSVVNISFVGYDGYIKYKAINLKDPADSYINDLIEAEISNFFIATTYDTINDGNDLHPIFADSVQGQRPELNELTPSLFPNVPPYITFATYDKERIRMPREVEKVLKWRRGKITQPVIIDVLVESGFRLLDHTENWVILWGGLFSDSEFQQLKPYQKVNEMPGSKNLCHKNGLWQHIKNKILRHGTAEFDFYPLTFILPQDEMKLKQVWNYFKQYDTKWIIKPVDRARGEFIYLVNEWNQIPKNEPIIVQKYIDRPLLINERKFDMRLYVLVTSFDPLRVYMLPDGFARFAPVKYSNDTDNISNRNMHLTNFSINKHHANFTENEDPDGQDGHNWTLKTLFKHLKAHGYNPNGLWASMRNVVLRTLLSAEHKLNKAVEENVRNRYNTFDLYGFDVLLDEDLKPWVLEVNKSPSLETKTPLDAHVHIPLLNAILNTVRINVPPRMNTFKQKDLMKRLGFYGEKLCFDKRLHTFGLSEKERLKHKKFTSEAITRDQYLSSILDDLTPDDIRCLIASEDELARSAPLERVFPTPNSYRLLKFTEEPRYYNRLLDAWEHRYSNNRQNGIDLLRTFCKNGIHLIQPNPCETNKTNKIIYKNRKPERWQN